MTDQGGKVGPSKERGGRKTKPNFPRIIYTDHALDQMVERGINKQQVRNAVLYPTKVVTGNPPDREIAYKDKSDGRRLAVVYKSKGMMYIIITAIWKDGAK